MFPRHAQTRRQLVLLLYWMLCVVPTLGVGAWCVWSRLPWLSRAEAAWIGHLVGMDATLDDVRRPRPDTTLYCGLSLADRESGRPAFSCRRVEIRRGNGNEIGNGNGDRRPDGISPGDAPRDASGVASGGNAEKSAPQRPTVCVAFGETRCYAEQSHQWLRLLESLLAHRMGPAEADLHCTFDRLEVLRDERSYTLSDVTVTLSRASDATSLDVAFRTTEAADGPPGRIRVTRRREATSPAAKFELTCTEQSAVPCALLACFAPIFERTGVQSDFSGRLLGRETPDGWRYDIVDGLFRNVPLDRLVGDRFPPHRLEGVGRLELDRASASAGRLIVAEGLFAADGGRMSRELAEACATRLGMESPPQVAPGGLPFQRFEAQFLLDDRGLQLAASPKFGKTIAFARDGRPLWDEPPPGTIVPMAALLDALTPLRGAASKENTARTALRRRLPLEAEPALAERPSGKRR